MELISVIITTCSRSADIVMRAVRSVQNQTYSNWELLVIDDSPDSFPQRDAVEHAVLAAGDERIRYIKQKKNMGAQVARNTGLKCAKGDWVNFLDDDDEFLPHKLERHLEAATQNQVLWVTGKAEYLNEKSGRSYIYRKKVHSGNVYEKLLAGNFIPSITPLVNKACFECVGGFDETLEASQDYDMWLRIAKKFPLLYIQEVGVRIHLHGEERITRNPCKKLQGSEKVFKKYEEDLKRMPECYSRRMVWMAKIYIMSGKKEEAKRMMHRANKIYPKSIIRNTVRFRYWMMKYRK